MRKCNIAPKGECDEPHCFNCPYQKHTGMSRLTILLNIEKLIPRNIPIIITDPKGI